MQLWSWVFLWIINVFCTEIQFFSQNFITHFKKMSIYASKVFYDQKSPFPRYEILRAPLKIPATGHFNDSLTLNFPMNCKYTQIWIFSTDFFPEKYHQHNIQTIPIWKTNYSIVSEFNLPLTQFHASWLDSYKTKKILTFLFYMNL